MFFEPESTRRETPEEGQQGADPDDVSGVCPGDMPDDILRDERRKCVEFTRAKGGSGGTVRSGIRMLGAHRCRVGASSERSRLFAATN
jgi:hypothetical protein